MKRILVILMLFTVGFINAQSVVDRSLGEFDAIKVFNKIEVKLIKSTENRVQVSGIKRNDIVVAVKNRVLRIRMAINNIWDNNNTRVTVYYKDIHEIDVNEGSSAKVNGLLKSRDLTLKAQEGSNIKAEVKAERLVCKSVTGSEIFVNGYAAEQEVTINAGGNYYGEELKTKNTFVKVSAGGNAKVYATEYAKANTAAGGVIEIYGRPKELDTKKVLGGKIINVE